MSEAHFSLVVLTSKKKKNRKTHTQIDGRQTLTNIAFFQNFIRKCDKNEINSASETQSV